MSNLGFFNAGFGPKAQLDAFNAVKCEHIFYDEKDLMSILAPGDVVVMCDLPCAGASLVDALAFLLGLEAAGADFVCVQPDLDSRRSKEVYRTLAALQKLALAEPKTARRRTRQASGASEGEGEGGHRRGRASVDAATVDRALELYQAGTSVKDVCQEVGLSQGTLYKYLRERGISRR